MDCSHRGMEKVDCVETGGRDGCLRGPSVAEHARKGGGPHI